MVKAIPHSKIKEEMGKWFLDISKYILTAVIITALFAEIANRWLLLVIGIFWVLITMGIGLFFLKNESDYKNGNL